MNQTERLYHIDKLLRANRCVAVSRFLEELGISIATFKRDLEHLRNHLNAPIAWDRGCRGYRLEAPAQTGPRYELPGIWFNANEIHALLTIEHLLQHIEPGILHPFFSAFRERLAAILEQPESALREIERRVFIHHRFQRPTSPKRRADGPPPKWAPPR
jgi:predicted DNA-binding transcriptional regulator YafY